MDRARIFDWLRGRGPALLLDLAVNFAAPLLIYDRAQGHMSDVNALLLSSVPPVLWGFGLLADFLVSTVLIYALSIEQYLVVGPILGYATMGGLALWTILYRRHRTRYGKALRAKAAAEQLEG